MCGHDPTKAAGAASSPRQYGAAQRVEQLPQQRPHLGVAEGERVRIKGGEMRSGEEEVRMRLRVER